MVVVNRLTKITYFIHTITTITAYEVVELFMRNVFRYHGLPREINTDRDHKFVSEFLTTLFKLCGPKVKLSIAYHPETDGQTEKFIGMFLKIKIIKSKLLQKDSNNQHLATSNHFQLVACKVHILGNLLPCDT